MVPMEQESDGDIDDFLRSLPRAPEAWVSRAEEMPLLERALGLLHQRGRSGDTAAMRSALLEVGLEPDERRVRALERLRDLRRN
jgi:hypothetical protein